MSPTKSVELKYARVAKAFIQYVVSWKFLDALMSTKEGLPDSVTYQYSAYLLCLVKLVSQAINDFLVF